MKSLYQPALSLVSLCLLSASLYGDEWIVDQSNVFDPNGPIVRLNMIAPGLVAPEVGFTPATNTLNFVDLLTESGGGSPAATLQVLILRDGAVVGASDLLDVTNSVPATYSFRFYPSVPLVPGTNYVIEVQSVDGWWTALGKSDLFFREGTVVPAPVPPPLTIHLSYIDVCWSSRTDKTYQVQYRSGLTTNIWTDLGAPIPGNGFTNCITDSLASPQRVYRVKVLP